MFIIFLRNLKKINKIAFIILYSIVSFNVKGLSENINSKNTEIYKNSSSNKNKIIWEALEIKNNVDSNIIWQNFQENNLKDKGKLRYKNFNDAFKKSYLNKNSIYSFNRSIAFNNKIIGPDISFMVPIGFKSVKGKMFDFSFRGWNRRPENSSLFSWNDGDAVAQIYYQFLNNDKSSFGFNLGIRSIYQGNSNLSGAGSNIGEGSSAGFRWDYQLGEQLGVAFGAEQLVQFDSKSDTGRDIYLTFSKAFLQKNNEKNFPIFVTTVGVGTGYLALWDKSKFACSDLFDGASVDLAKYHKLCWGPFGTLSFVINEKNSIFFEYNNYSFMVGSSLSLRNRLRLTSGLVLAESYDDYKLKNFDELRVFGRLSIVF